MAKFPTEVERSVTVKVPIAKAYKYLWDVVRSSTCIPEIEQCERAGKDTFLFTFQEKAAGPISLKVRYTCKYEGNGVDEITFESTNAKNDNTDVSGRIRFKASGDGTKVVLWQRLAPDTPVPSLLQGFIRSYVEKEAGEAVRQYLANVKKELEGKG
jgi:carbon monoxide dehydrogenase subunit G